MVVDSLRIPLSCELGGWVSCFMGVPGGSGGVRTERERGREVGGRPDVTSLLLSFIVQI